MNTPKPQLPLYQKPNDQDKSMWTLSYRLKGIAFGLMAFAAYCYIYLGYYPIKYFIAAGILGYFLGWVAGSFFYTKKP